MESIMTYGQSFFGWLMQATLIASVIICLILLIQKMLGAKLGPRWCHTLWLVLLIRMVLPWAPASRMSVLNLIPSWDRQIRRAQPPEATEQQGLSGAGKASDTEEAIPAQKSEFDITVQKQSIPEQGAIADMQIESQPWLVSLRRVLPVFWLVGSIVIGTYLLVSNFALWRIVKRDSPLVNQSMLELFEECKTQMGIQSLVVVVPSSQIRSPALFGFIRPRLLLPLEMLEKASREEMRYVFLHELAHLKRRDIYLGWLTSLLQILHWFNPLIWFAFYRMRSDRELACDSLVLARTQKEESQEYGQAIVSLVRRFSRSRPLPAMAGIIESRSQLKRRITMITQFKKNSYQWSPLAVILIIIIACVSLPDAKHMKASETANRESAQHISVRRVWSDPLVSGLLGEPSPDGRYLSYVDWESGDLAIYEIASGKKRRLTNKGPWHESKDSALESRWSPDGTQVAYAWETESGSVELRIVGLDGSDPRIFYSLDEQMRWIELSDWFPDGRYVLAHCTGKDGTDQIVQISTVDGSLKVLKTVGKDCLGHVVFSPDGKYVAYDIKQEADEHTVTRDIRLVSTDGTHEIPLVAHPADDAVLGWAPDGSHILFASDRAGSQGVWLVAVSKGAPQGAPKLVRSGRFAPLGFTCDGSFYYGVSHFGSYVYVATLDSKTDKILDAPEKTPLRYEGRTVVSAYSPDGKYLAYACELTSMVRRSHDPTFLCIRSLESGRERQFPVDLHLYSGSEPRWSPDCSTLLIGGKDQSNRDGLFRIDVRSGDIESVVMSEGENEIEGYDWAHDGKSVFYSYRNGQIVLRNLDTGKTKEVCPASSTRIHSKISVSPDGTCLALFILQSEDRTRYIKVISATGGEKRELLKFEKEDPIAGSVTWTADGKNILFASKAREQNDWELCQIPVEGGQVQKLGPDGAWWGWMNCLSAHPDGRRIAFRSGGPTPGHGEVWVMENFLPGAPVAKPEPTTTVRRVGYDWRGPFANLSPDGKYMSDRDWDTGTLVIHELATGKSRTLVGRDSHEDGFPLVSTISPDSKEVAYLWNDPNTKTSSLHIVGLDGAGHRVLCKGKYPMPMNWSADSQKILAVVIENGVQQMVWISTSDGSIKHIVDVSLGYLGKVDISSDGRFIAYNHPQSEDTLKRDIFVFDLRENREFSIINHPADDKFLGWTPDGRHIFFASDRTGTWDAWLLPVADGKPQGFPKLARHGIGNITPIGFTPQGSYYYGHEQTLRDVFVAKLDLESGEFLSEPMPVHQSGATDCHDWSPDGRYLAYCERRSDESQVVHIRTLATDRERTLSGNLPFIRWLRWFPDLRSILIDGYKRGDSQGAIFKIDVQTGERTDIVRSTAEVLVRPEMSPDGKTLFYERSKDPKSKTSRLIARDMESGREKELYRVVSPARLMNRALSPDGKQLVLSIVPDPTRPLAPVLKVLSVAGGEPRELIQFDKSENLRGAGVTWTPDSRYVLFWKWRFGADKELELWRISAEGGEPRKLCSRKAFGHMRVHPDGQRVAFYDRSTTRGLWALENFLPEDIGK